MLVDIVVKTSTPLAVVEENWDEGIQGHCKVESAHILGILKDYLVENGQSINKDFVSKWLTTYTKIKETKSIVHMYSLYFKCLP